MGMVRIVTSCLTVAWMATALDARATQPYEEYSKHIESAQKLTALDDNLMGDSISLYNGATEFRATDISLPGNNALAVELSRRFSVELIISSAGNSPGSPNYGGIGNWDIEVPYVTTMWGQTAWPSARCTQQPVPNVPVPLSPTDTWHGNNVHLPGAGDRKLLWIASLPIPKPTSGPQIYWTSRERDMVSCIPMQFGYPGEGFLLQTAGGLKYYFDVMTTRSAGTIQYQSMGYGTTFGRMQYYVLASKVEDRFGNTVTYAYNASGYPTTITSNDGRQIKLFYTTSGALDYATVNSGAALRTWDYSYGTGGNSAELTTVTLPDDSKWKYSHTGSMAAMAEMWDGNTGANCNQKPPPTGASYSLTVTHPGGAQGVFAFRTWRHPRSGVHMNACSDIPVEQDGTFWVDIYKLVIPNFFDSMTLASKTIAGPGLTSRLWTYEYPSGSVPLWGARGDNKPYPCADTTACPPEKVVTVHQPDGTKTDYTYGYLYASNEGRLLKTTTYDQSNIVKHVESTTYLSESDADGQNFYVIYGYGFGDDEPSTLNVRPIVSRVITQDGTDFISVVADDCGGLYCFDRFARQTKTIKASMAAGTSDMLPPSGTPTLTVPTTSTTGSYTVSWTSVPYAATYQLQERLNGGAWATIQNTAATSTALSGKTNDTWDYQVRACNVQACTGWSAIASIEVKVPPSTAPTVTAPASSNNGSYTVTWTTAARATRYELDERKNSGGWVNIYNGSDTNKARSGLTSGTYQYRVRACNDGGCSAYSAAASTTVTIISTPPAAPASLTAPATVEQWADFNVLWSSVSGATSYKLERNDDGTNWNMVYSGAATGVSQSLMKVGSYLYRAQACNSQGVCGAYSPTKVVTVTRATTFAPVVAGE